MMSICRGMSGTSGTRIAAADGQWTGRAPHLSEEVYNLEDALVVAQWMNVFLRKSDVLKIACLAQIVNVISPHPDHPRCRCSSTRPIIRSCCSASWQPGPPWMSPSRPRRIKRKKFGDMPLLDVSSSFDEASGAHAIFIVNRSQTESLPVELHWQDRAPKRINAVYQLAGKDPKAVNSFEKPDQIVAVKVDAPTIQDQHTMLTLPPLSFTAIDARLG